MFTMEGELKAVPLLRGVSRLTEVTTVDRDLLEYSAQGRTHRPLQIQAQWNLSGIQQVEDIGRH